MLSRYLDTSGDGTGTKDAAVDATAGDLDFATGDVNTTTDVITEATHGLSTGGGPYFVSSDNTLPGGLSANTRYWIIAASAGTYQIAASYADAIAETAVDLTTQGAGTHTLHIPILYYIQAPAGEVYYLTRMLASLSDTQTLDADKYGNNIVLTEGIEIWTRNDTGITIDLTDGIPILTNGAWAQKCYDLADTTFGSGNDHLHVRWTFAASGKVLCLVGDSNDRLEVRLNDDFSGLAHHLFMVQGWTE